MDVSSHGQVADWIVFWLTRKAFQNEALRNLMMSWYWAGYYTGHYEGQEHAKKFLDSTTQESQKKDR